MQSLMSQGKLVSMETIIEVIRSYANFDIVFGPFWDHFLDHVSRVSQLHPAPQALPCAMLYLVPMPIGC